MDDITALSLLEMRRALVAGDISATELLQAHLDRIAETNPVFNSFVTVSGEKSLEYAQKADEVLRRLKGDSPFLSGIPIAVKDMLVTRGVETSCGSNMLKGFIPPYDCTAVAKLRNAGAIIVGKTNLDEFAMGSSTETSAFGPVRNPYDTGRVPGGSSGGSAAAVALGQVPASLGTDTGGSIRQPASFCGVVGVKPTYGRVSRYGAVAYASSCDQIGPLARRVSDAAAILFAISGKDESDSTSVDREVPNFLDELEAASNYGLDGLRIGVPKEYFAEGINPEVEQAVGSALGLLEHRGARIVDISLPHTQYALATYYVLVTAEASSNLSRYDGIRYGHRSTRAGDLNELYEKSRQEGFGNVVKQRILVGSYVLSAGYYDAYYKKAQQVRSLIIEDFREAFDRCCDVIVSPTSPTTAFKLGEKTKNPVEMYLADVFTVPLNLAGIPGISIPCGLDEAGLPIGLQLMARPFAESLLFRVSEALEEEVGFDSGRTAVSLKTRGGTST